MTAVTDTENKVLSGTSRTLFLIAGTIVTIFGLGVLAVLIAALLKAGQVAGVDILLILGGLAVTAAGLALFGKGARGQWLPRSPSQRRAATTMVLTIAIGFVIGAGMGTTDSMTGLENSLASEPISRPAAWVFIGGLAVAMPLSIWWLRLIDEHERAAHDLACVAALYLYSWLAPTWWFAWRGGLTNEPQHGVIFALTIAAFCIVWLFRKFR